MLKQILAGVMIGVLGFAAIGGDAQAKLSHELKAAAGEVDITPTGTAFIAGYGSNRKSIDAHDKLKAKCLILESGGVRIAIVSCDLIGVPRYQVEKIRALVKSVKPENIMIAATHTHSGPDTVGQWGASFNVSGVDQEWMTEFRQKTAALIDETYKKISPAKIRFAESELVPRVSKNIRIPSVLDTTLSLMQVVSKSKGKPISTLVNYACHPEILNTRRITADFPHWLYETVEGGGGGVCLYLNGAQGGMITADFDESTTPKGENWQAAETIGTALGKRVLELISTSEFQEEAKIIVQRSVFFVPLENANFKALIKLKVFPQDVVKTGIKDGIKTGMIETEVNRIRIGGAEIFTFPGEVLPNIGLFLRGKMTGSPKFQFGLADDFLGYILTPEDFNLKLYQYESSVSVGADIEPLMIHKLLGFKSENVFNRSPK